MATSFSLKRGETRTSHGPIPHPLSTLPSFKLLIHSALHEKVGRVCIWGKFALMWRLCSGASLYTWGKFVNVASRPSFVLTFPFHASESCHCGLGKDQFFSRSTDDSPHLQTRPKYTNLPHRKVAAIQSCPKYKLAPLFVYGKYSSCMVRLSCILSSIECVPGSAGNGLGQQTA